LLFSKAFVPLQCCQNAKGLKVEEEEDEDYLISEKYQSKFVVLRVGLV
jgi:hypothetical protein